MDSDFKTALVKATKQYDPDLLRPALVRRTMYTFALAEDPETFEALVNGAIPNAIAWNNTIFWLDETDTTTPHDGVTVIRTSDDYCYKIEDIDMRVRSVMSFTTEDPPAMPAVGESYLVPAGATGAWSSHQDDITTYTPRGWVFEIPTIGRWILDEEVDGYLRYSADGWLYGPGARSFDDDSVPLSASLGWGERVIVENQTTTTPPTATKGLRYVVGALATGAWLGKDKQIAICEVDGVWTFYPPSNGWSIYDKSQNNTYVYNGTSWISAAGAAIGRAFKRNNNNTNTSFQGGVSGSYTYDSVTGPTTSSRARVDVGTTISYAAKKANTDKIELVYDADVFDFNTSGSLSTSQFQAALFRGAESASIDWQILDIKTLAPLTHISARFVIGAADTTSHDYHVRIVSWVSDGSNLADVNNIYRRKLTLTEYD